MSENMAHDISPAAATWTDYTAMDVFLYSCSLPQILALPSE